VRWLAAADNRMVDWDNSLAQCPTTLAVRGRECTFVTTITTSVEECR
jgi:hypothetical protein